MRILSDQDKIDVVNKYNNNQNIDKIALEYGVSYSSIRSILKNRNVKLRSKKYPIDDTFFEKIDTEEKAYFLGFLYADGNVHLDENLKRNTLSLEMQERDEKIASRLSHVFYGFEKLYRRQRKNHWKTMVCLRVNSKKVCKNLITLGCVPRKSFLIRFPNNQIVPNEFIPHFIRGFFDGDGGFHVKSTSKKGKIEITSNPNFCDDLSQVLKDKFGIVSYPYKRNRGGNRKIIGSLQIYDRQSIKKFYDVVYNNSSIYLDRKKDLMYAYIKSMDDRYFRKYRVYTPNGKIEEVVDIEKFCDGKDIFPSDLIKVAEGKRKSVRGYKAMFFEDTEFRWRESRGKTFKVVKPNGEIIKIYNLSQFCKQNDLNYHGMVAVLVGKSTNHKGYKCMQEHEDKPKFISRKKTEEQKMQRFLQKKFRLHFKNGDMVEVGSLHRFCREHNYNCSTIYQVKTGKRQRCKDIIRVEKIT